MIVVDASVLIAYLDPNDGHHLAAVELLAEAAPPLFVHPITAAEVLVAPVRRGLGEQVWSDLAMIGVQVDHQPISPLEIATIRVESGCKMPDCCVLALAARRGVAIATFDQRLAKHALAAG